MFFLSKLLGLFVLPSNVIGIVGVLGLLGVATGFRRLGRVLLVLSAILLALAGWAPFGTAALVVLEDRFPQPEVADPVVGIVMLGGAVNAHVTAVRRASTFNDAAERVTVVAELSRRFPDARILLSGGAGELAFAEPLTESAIARDVLIAVGVSPDRIALEERSRTTCENAVESLRSARPAAGERWLLVTSASHMPRAIACFRAVGFPVIPYPVDYRTRGRADLWRPIQSISEGLKAADAAAHEWIGLLVYRALGRTTELFPSP